ncbi:MAG: amidohydrolase family protein [Boseongicola sp.]|nr:amidohydrolase family protein [Boseongicola sp.]MYI70113.1 amidohydrolase family protein [Boseongicola sp. SB0673_bin_14]
MLHELVLRNGRVHTMDGNGTVVSSVSIESGRFAAIGDDVQPRGPDARVIDLQGRTVIPGLIDNHIHFLRTGLLPGHDMRLLETSFSIDEALLVIRDRARKVPDGQLLSAIGGIHPDQFAERRYPTMSELDDAAPRNPVYLSISNWGPGATNALAKSLLEDLGVPVGEDGIVAKGQDTVAAWEALSKRHSYADTLRQTASQMDHALSMGLTNLFDMGGTIPAGGWLDPATGYNPVLDLMREGRVPMRIRVYLPVLDKDASLPDLMSRLDYTFNEFGNDVLRIAGIGEWLIPNKLQREQPLPDFYTESVRAVAERGWVYKQHLISLAEQKEHLRVWEEVNKCIPIADLHWSMDHCYGIDAETISRAMDLGVGISSHSSPYLEGTLKPPGNPPFRMILDSGIMVGGGSDGARISVMNPWVMFYYAVTGRNHAGEVINPDQTVSREEILQIWTKPQGWFCKEERNMGGIAVGKFGDLAVLSADYFDEAVVSDDAIREITSVMTIVGGRVVHNSGELGDHALETLPAR